MTQPRPTQVVGAIKVTALVHKKRPGHLRLLRVRSRRSHPFESDRHHPHGQRVNGLGLLLQLPQVSATGKSISMPVQNQQQPVPTVGLKGVLAPTGVRQSKWNSWPIVSHPKRRCTLRLYGHGLIRRTHQPTPLSRSFDKQRSAGETYRGFGNAPTPSPEGPTMAEQRTLAQRALLWILNALLFFMVALYPAYQMAAFASDNTVRYTFLSALVVMVALYAAASKLFFKDV